MHTHTNTPPPASPGPCHMVSLHRKVSEVMPTMSKELPAIVLNLQCFFTGFASLKTPSQTIKHPYSYLPDLATILQTQDLLPWLAPCGGSKALVAVRTSSHALCSSSHRNHSMHPHMGLLCREKHRQNHIHTYLIFIK